LRAVSQPAQGGGSIFELYGAALDVLYPAGDLSAPRGVNVAGIVRRFAIQALEQRARCLGAIGRWEFE
jgi:hypothetical protein